MAVLKGWEGASHSPRVRNHTTVWNSTTLEVDVAQQRVVSMCSQAGQRLSLLVMMLTVLNLALK
jgi:hypothetical protein